MVLASLSACSRSGSGQGGASGAVPQIRLTPAHDGDGPLVEVIGLPARDLTALRHQALTQEEWSGLLRVSVTDDAGSNRNRPAMLGSYSIGDEAIRFKPMYPLDPGRPYQVIFDPSRLPQTADVGRVPWRARRTETTISEAATEVHPATRVVAIYPTAEIVPENQLRLYIYFSAPMGLAGGLDHVRLLDDAGHAVEGAFVPMDVGLWNADRTRFTLLFDPGRVKRGVLANERLGRPIRKGRTYTLVVNGEWLDGRGQPLVARHLREFRVGDPLERPLDPSTWRLEPPSVGTRDPLVVSFPTSLDYALMQRALGVWSARGEAVEGEVRVEAAETRWIFVPRMPWRAGAHHLVAFSILEDPAGNRIGRPFELNPSDPPPPGIEERSATLPFQVAPRAH